MWYGTRVLVMIQFAILKRSGYRPRKIWIGLLRQRTRVPTKRRGFKCGKKEGKGNTTMID